MAIDNNHITKLGELKSLIDQLWSKIKSTFSAIGHTHVKADITDFPSSMPASDVSDWAKASTKPTYTASEVGALPDTTVIPTVPTNVSAFNNDAGYITESTVDKEIFWCTNSTTFSEITSAINDGKFVVVKYRYTPAEGIVLDYTIPIVDGDVKTNKYTFSRIINSTGHKVDAEITSDDEWSFRYGGSWGIDITGNAATADNASGRKFTVQSEGEEAFIKASNGTQSVFLDVLGDGSKRGIYCNASGTGSSVWALQIDKNNVVTLNGNATTASNAKNSVFEVKKEATECLFRASNGTQTVSLDVNADGSKRGIYCNASGTGSSVWALQINKNNVVTLNGTATNATSASSAVKASQDGQGNVIANTYQKLQPITIGASGIANAAYIAPPIICVRDGSAITATTISGIVNSCCSLAYRANKGRQYIILNTSSSSVTITGFANSKSWALTAGTFMTCVYWGGSYYREDN